MSTVDLFAGQWVLMSGPNGRPWGDAVSRSPAARRLGLTWYGLEPDGGLTDVANRFSAAFRVGLSDAVLIRPDGFVAWRSRGVNGDATEALDSALERLTMMLSAVEDA